MAALPASVVWEDKRDQTTKTLTSPKLLLIKSAAQEKRQRVFLNTLQQAQRDMELIEECLSNQTLIADPELLIRLCYVASVAKQCAEVAKTHASTHK